MTQPVFRLLQFRECISNGLFGSVQRTQQNEVRIASFSFPDRQKSLLPSLLPEKLRLTSVNPNADDSVWVVKDWINGHGQKLVRFVIQNLIRRELQLMSIC